MFNKTIKILFIVIFSCLLLVPLVFSNMQEGKVSEAEKRTLAPQAHFLNDDGTFNKDFFSDYERWINDNIGFRDFMVINNARIQYYLFNVLANNSNMYLGPNGELNYATNTMINDYQHQNLYDENYLQDYASSMQCLSDYAKSKGADFYYFQCWDKHSIYPEQFPTSIIQYGTESKTDGMIRALEQYTDVKVISPKKELIEEKEQHSTYSRWGDPSHWNWRGAFIGYQQLMKKINQYSENQYDILNESDYNIELPDWGETLFGGIHEVDKIEWFATKENKAILSNDKLNFLSEDQRHSFYVNNNVDNKTRLLILGDSYFNSFIVDDIAQSFYETIMIWTDHIEDYCEIINEYKPDIVVFESAERMDRSRKIITAADKIIIQYTEKEQRPYEEVQVNYNVGYYLDSALINLGGKEEGYLSIAAHLLPGEYSVCSDVTGNLVRQKVSDIFSTTTRYLDEGKQLYFCVFKEQDVGFSFSPIGETATQNISGIKMHIRKYMPATTTKEIIITKEDLINGYYDSGIYKNSDIRLTSFNFLKIQNGDMADIVDRNLCISFVCFDEKLNYLYNTPYLTPRYDREGTTKTDNYTFDFDGYISLVLYDGAHGPYAKMDPENYNSVIKITKIE